MSTPLSRRRFAMLGAAACAGLAGCEAADPLTEAPREMGNFRLGFNIVVAENAKKIPPSRNAEPAEWQAVLKSEIDRRFGRYEGAKEFHIALNIDGYALAPPGIPIVLTPKSILVVSANIWSAELGQKILGPEQISTFEGADTLLLGSGLVKTADEQMVTLARNMAGKVQSWMLRNPEWFDLPPRG
ncbi:hypothetical protein [Jannaschia ovalis]|uniref:DUF3313 domain-containing protein n=1 Tax=Jannaschia ovalis TaxID=3038773 RepID=A0ABY8LGA4_9RHOB|nr:hypothetical protein [Jannaschia sp. GRR-S6-38]WGH79184.1 hypothetical protein P8627_02665 [Jannaschia sp. GRR-S6-38]